LEDLQEIIAGCVLNDRKSQEKLYKQFYITLYCLCRRFFPNEHEAVESVNDGMMKVFERIGTFHPDRGKFFNWVYTIVRHTALDKLRASVARTTYTDVIDAELIQIDLINNPIRSMESKDLYLLLDRLTPATRVIFDLFYIEGYAIKDIADELTISAGTVKWHLSDGRRKLKTLLIKHFNE
jgi:RNA polymerase sigma factor (sigma-70 family)